MKDLYKPVIALVACGAVMIYVLNSTFNDVSKQIKEEEKKYKKHIGNTYVMDKDTLTIVDYSMFEENFTLSDGRKVNYSLIGKD